MPTLVANFKVCTRKLHSPLMAGMLRLGSAAARLMRMFSERFGWKPIDSAPIDQGVALIVTDGGEPYELRSPFKLFAAGLVRARVRCSP
jgi:hypothetical protein